MAQIIRAQHMGFCFGVRDALKLAEDTNDPEQTVIYGELVHNEMVNESLRKRRFEILAESDRESLTQRTKVMVTAHGISDRRPMQL